MSVVKVLSIQVDIVTMVLSLKFYPPTLILEITFFFEAKRGRSLDSTFLRQEEGVGLLSDKEGLPCDIFLVFVQLQVSLSLIHKHDVGLN